MFQQIWPKPVTLDDEGLVSAYGVGDRSESRVRVNFVTSVDGAVETQGLSEGLTTPADQVVFQTLRALSDVVVVGAGTLRTEEYQPLRVNPDRQQWRRHHGLPDNPVLAIVSGRLALDPDAPNLAEAPRRPIVITHAASPPERQEALAKVADLVICGEHRVDLRAAFAELAGRGLRQILCEGGPQLFGTLVSQDGADEVCLTLSPLLAGPGSGRIIDGPASPELRRMTLGHVIAADDGSLFLRYERFHPPTK